MDMSMTMNAIVAAMMTTTVRRESESTIVPTWVVLERRKGIFLVRGTSLLAEADQRRAT
jgi:hypothetical protein